MILIFFLGFFPVLSASSAPPSPPQEHVVLAGNDKVSPQEHVVTAENDKVLEVSN